MKLSEIFRRYSSEQKSKLAFKRWRDGQGICCKKCKGLNHYWKKDKWQYECKNCGFRTTLKSGTALEGSKMPYQHWMIVIGLMSATKKSFSALEVQRQLGHKRYEPVWLMMHKLRVCMGRRDDKYQLDGQIELDEGLFDSHRVKSLGSLSPKLKRQVKVLVMVQSERVKQPHKNETRPRRKVGYLKMKVLDQAGQKNVNYEVKKHVKRTAKAITDGHGSFQKLEEVIDHHLPLSSCGDASMMSKVLPSVHITISNAKKLFLGTHHSIKRDYMQNYLNEFCYKFNRRYLTQNLFGRLMIACVEAPWYDFR